MVNQILMVREAADSNENGSIRLNVRTIRIIYSDPDATDDSSSDEKSSPKRCVVREIHLPRNKNNSDPDAADDSSVVSEIHRSQKKKKKKKKKKKNRQKKKEAHQTSRTTLKEFPGARRRQCGSWAAEIRDRFLKRRIWLGTYDTPEEASKVYLAKKREIEARDLRHGTSSSE